jgi:septum formation protein
VSAPLAWTGDLTLVLASASPQRRAILDQLGIAHVVRPTGAEEFDGGDPAEAAAANARAKAHAALAALNEAERRSSVVLACDTVVALDGRVYGKPADAAQAREYVAALAGRTHEVLGALAIAAPDGALRERTDVTKVSFAALSEAEIAAYVATGEWEGRAGGYAIQGAGGAIVERIEGDYLNVVGLPVHALRDLVTGLVPPFSSAAAP